MKGGNKVPNYLSPPFIFHTSYFIFLFLVSRHFIDGRTPHQSIGVKSFVGR